MWPSVLFSVPPHNTPVPGLRTMICPRPYAVKSVATVTSWPRASIDAITSADTSGSRPTLFSPNHCQRGASRADWGFIPKSIIFVTTCSYKRHNNKPNRSHKNKPYMRHDNKPQQATQQSNNRHNIKFNISGLKTRRTIGAHPAEVRCSWTIRVWHQLFYNGVFRPETN